MNRAQELEPCFVEAVPRQLEEGKLYISIAFGSVNHLCACGCKCEVVTPLHPARWAMIYDGETVSLWPSIGSFGLPCRSHYVIDCNRVEWKEPWSDDKVEGGRARDRRVMERHFQADEQRADAARETKARPTDTTHPKKARRLRRLLCRIRSMS